jgi:sporulation protein YlmC with PRC-barrel domain
MRMKKASLFLTMLVLASLLLAACGAQETPTSVPSTSVPPATNTSEMTATEAATEAPTSTAQADLTSTPAIPVTGGNTPSQMATNLIGSSICGAGGDQLGTVLDMVLDFNQAVVTYMIVDAKGKQVAVPYSFLVMPATGGTGTGSGTGSSGTGTLSTSTPSTGGSGSSGSGALSTDTPAAGLAVSTATSTTGASSGTLATDTPAAGVAISTATPMTGTGSSSGTTGSGTSATGQQGCLALTVSNDVFTNAPAFDQTVMPATGQSAQDWDTNIMGYWMSGGTETATATPAASGGASATATITPGVQQIQGVMLMSALLGSNVSINSANTGTGAGSSLGTSTPAAGGSSSTALPETTATASSAGTGSGSGTGATLSDGSQGTVQDVVIEPRIGKLQYLVVSFDSGSTSIPVPISLVGWDATNSQIVLMTSAGMLQNAPTFSSGQAPDTSMAGWDQQFSSYWSGGGSTGSGTGSGGITVSTATATP